MGWKDRSEVVDTGEGSAAAYEAARLSRSRRAQDAARTGQRAEELTGTDVPTGPSEPSMIPDVEVPFFGNLRRFAPGEDPGASLGERAAAAGLAYANKLSMDIVPTAREAMSGPAGAAKLLLKMNPATAAMGPAVESARRGLSLAHEHGVPVPDFLLPDAPIDPESDEGREAARATPESAAADLAPASYGQGALTGDIVNLALGAPGVVEMAPTVRAGLGRGAADLVGSLKGGAASARAAATSPAALKLAAAGVEKAPYAVGAAGGGLVGHPVVGGLVGKAALGGKADAMAARLRLRAEPPSAAPSMSPYEAAVAEAMGGGMGAGVEPPIPGGSPMPPGVHPNTPAAQMAGDATAVDVRAPIDERTDVYPMPNPSRGLAPKVDYGVSGMPEGARPEHFPLEMTPEAAAQQFAAQAAGAPSPGFSIPAELLRENPNLNLPMASPMAPARATNPAAIPSTPEEWLQAYGARDRTPPQGLLDEVAAAQPGTGNIRAPSKLQLGQAAPTPSPPPPPPIRFAEPVTEGRVPPMSPTDAAELRDINLANNATREEMGGYVRQENLPSSQAYNEAMARDEVTRGGPMPQGRSPPPSPRDMAASMSRIPPAMRDAALAAIEKMEGPAYAAEVRAALGAPFARAKPSAPSLGSPPGIRRGRGRR